MFAAGEKLIMFDRSLSSTTQKPTDLKNVKYVSKFLSLMTFLSVLQWYDGVFTIFVARPDYNIYFIIQLAEKYSKAMWL